MCKFTTALKGLLFDQFHCALRNGKRYERTEPDSLNLDYLSDFNE